MLGAHTMKHWSSTQASTALSSGEAEFNGVVRGSGQGLGYQSLLVDLGIQVPLRVWTDSSAAIGVCSRQGLGKLRHLDTHTLWVQQAVRTGKVDLRKVLGEENPAELFTKHSLTKARMEHLVSLHGCRYAGGRAESAPLTRKGASDKFTLADAGLHVTGMPHLSLSEKELDERFPTLSVPNEEELDDSLVEFTDRHDTVLQHGMAIARGIAHDMRTIGRTRHGPAERPAGQARGAGDTNRRSTDGNNPTDSISSLQNSHRWRSEKLGPDSSAISALRSLQVLRAELLRLPEHPESCEVLPLSNRLASLGIARKVNQIAISLTRSLGTATCGSSTSFAFPLTSP